jgi:hypothetical protein
MIEALRRVVKRMHYPLEIMLVCVRWYAAYPLSWFCRDSAIKPSRPAGPMSIRKPASRTGSLQTRLAL